MVCKIQKPILKWVGGKTQIIEMIINEFPKEINNYHEIFLGGASVLFALLSCVKNGIVKITGKVYAYDINEPLIYVYKNIQDNHQELYNEIQKLVVEFNSCKDENVVNRKPKNINEAKMSRENYYYWIRRKYNDLNSYGKKSVYGSSLFIFLNKTCFRGVYRVGPNGFNVPFGHYKNPKIIDEKHLEETHELIKDVIFECCDFKISMNKPVKSDFVYLDPPYFPITKTSFVNYNSLGFSIDDHNNLFNLVHKLTSCNVKILLSNADVSQVRDNFENENYKLLTILCKRAINAKTPNAKAKEVIVKNY
jgi:DNA adenine methylase